MQEPQQEPREDFFQGKWQKERDCFKGVLKDNYISSDSKVQSELKNNIDWPGETSDIAKENAWNIWLDRCVDKRTNQYYLAKDDRGLPIENSKPTYKVRSIYRLRRMDVDNSEYLYSTGYVVGHDAHGDELEFSISFPERWQKTHFKYETTYNEKRRSLVKECKGVDRAEWVYTTPFTKEAAKKLFDQRENNRVRLSVKDEMTGRTFEVRPDVNPSKTFERFCKGFDYLINCEYLSPQEKSELRSQAIQEGLIQGTVTEVTNVPANPPPKGAYS